MFSVGDLVELIGSHTSFDGKVMASGSKGRIVNCNTRSPYITYMVDCSGILVITAEHSIKPAAPIVRASSLADNYTLLGAGDITCGGATSAAPSTGYSATIKGFDIKCECGTASVRGGKHSTWCPVKETDNA